MLSPKGEGWSVYIFRAVAAWVTGYTRARLQANSGGLQMEGRGNLLPALSQPAASWLLICGSGKQQQIPIRIFDDEVFGAPRLLLQFLVKGNAGGPLVPALPQAGDTGARSPWQTSDGSRSHPHNVKRAGKGSPRPWS